MPPVSPNTTVFFDVDGTLFDHYHSMRCDHHVQRGRFQKVPVVLQELDLAIPGDEDLAEFRNIYRQAYRNSRRATPGSIETLLQLREQGVRLAIFTNGQAKDQLEKAKAIGVHHFMDYMITSEEAGCCKPDTAIFQLAIEALGCSLEKTYMVGDSVESDIKGAINSGMNVILFSPMATNSHLSVNAKTVPVIQDLSQLTRILGVRVFVMVQFESSGKVFAAWIQNIFTGKAPQMMLKASCLFNSKSGEGRANSGSVQNFGLRVRLQGALAQFAPSQKVKTELMIIGNDREAYSKFLGRNHVTLARLLKHTIAVDPAATWAGLPLSFIIDFLPAMQPHLYSISTSRITSPRSEGLTVSVKPSPLLENQDIQIPGLASTHLSKLQPGQVSSAGEPTIDLSFVHAQIRGSTSKLPFLSSVPLIMVAAGTGVALFRTFIQERARLASVGKEVGRMILFFGCQNNSDYLYRHEFAEWMAGPLAGKLEVVTAFSRADSEKCYVQNKVQARGEDVGRMLLEDDAAFYICGAANMAKDVGSAVERIVKQANGWEGSQVESWRQERKRSKRWFEDVWT
ncbi:HAD-like domain-containing protein [Colletotrichum phormii]|uniref:HAD-like domain-containing protein n=1 Tax=Colletotrichum phormii TaxID=359342 RepID=A0AAI9ZC62_9PEZI|nr:HAD-like domain-containing protein [Colletotrichum phormii]KAK1621523.1 HAD-like domain-containing protein [Colletotrichum phormii]